MMGSARTDRQTDRQTNHFHEGTGARRASKELRGKYERGISPTNKHAYKLAIVTYQ